MNETRMSSGHRVLGMRLLKDILAIGRQKQPQTGGKEPQMGGKASSSSSSPPGNIEGSSNDTKAKAVDVAVVLSPYVSKYAILHLAASGKDATPFLDSGM